MRASEDQLQKLAAPDEDLNDQTKYKKHNCHRNSVAGFDISPGHEVCFFHQYQALHGYP